MNELKSENEIGIDEGKKLLINFVGQFEKTQRPKQSTPLKILWTLRELRRIFNFQHTNQTTAYGFYTRSVSINEINFNWTVEFLLLFTQFFICSAF
jgi:hypothetical protein